MASNGDLLGDRGAVGTIVQLGAKRRSDSHYPDGSVKIRTIKIA